MMKQLKKRISKGEKAMHASGYILPLLESYSHEIFLSLEKGENLFPRLNVNEEIEYIKSVMVKVL